MRGMRLVAVIAAAGAFLAAPAVLVARAAKPPAPAIGEARPALSVSEARAAQGEPAAAAAIADPLEAGASTQSLRVAGDGEEPGATASATRAVRIGDYFYNPDRLTVKEGDRVVWTNDGEVPEGHTVTGDGFDSMVIEEGDSYTHTFAAVGTFDYVCTLHDNMTGSVVVEERRSGGGATPDGGDTPVDDSGDDGGGTGGVAAGDGSGSEGSDDSGSSGPAESGSGVDIPLASTGLDAGLLAVIGLNVLLLGLLVRIRVRGRPV